MVENNVLGIGVVDFCFVTWYVVVKFVCHVIFARMWDVMW